MSDWPVGLSTGCFYKKSIFDCLHFIQKSGFSMIEVCSYPQHLDYHDKQAVKEVARQLNELGIEAYSFHAPFSKIDITSLDKNEQNESVHEIFQAAESAALLNVRHFVMHPGPEKVMNPPEDERMKRLHNAANVLKKVAQKCKELKIGFTLENMLPHLLFGNVRDMLWIMGAIDEINIGTCLDTGHANISGDIINVMYKLSHHLQLLHINDNRGKDDLHLPPGKGEIDWNLLLRQLSEVGFHGGLILELSSREDNNEEIVLHEARQARLFLRNISKMLDISSPPTVGGPY